MARITEKALMARIAEVNTEHHMDAGDVGAFEVDLAYGGCKIVRRLLNGSREITSGYDTPRKTLEAFERFPVSHWISNAPTERENNPALLNMRDRVLAAFDSAYRDAFSRIPEGASYADVVKAVIDQADADIHRRRTVKVCFLDSTYDYQTEANGTHGSIRRYFVGQAFFEGTQVCKGVKFIA